MDALLREETAVLFFSGRGNTESQFNTESPMDSNRSSTQLIAVTIPGDAWISMLLSNLRVATDLAPDCRLPFYIFWLTMLFVCLHWVAAAGVFVKSACWFFVSIMREWCSPMPHCCQSKANHCDFSQSVSWICVSFFTLWVNLYNTLQIGKKFN